MKNVLITGANSYLGVSLKEYLEKQGTYQVQSVSVREESAWQELSFAGVDAIYHVAGLVHQAQSKEDAAQLEYYRRVNTRLPVAIAQKARAEGVKQFIFLSTAAVYGLTAPYGKTVTITADTPEKPVDNYGISKLEAERELRELEGENFHVAILRPPMIYGKGCKGNFRTLEAMAAKLPCFPKVENQRSMLYVENLNALVEMLLQEGTGGLYCPQDREYVNTSAMVQAIAMARGKKMPLLPGFGWALKLLRPFTGAVDKAFGSLCYSRELSAYKKEYCQVSFPETVERTQK